MTILPNISTEYSTLEQTEEFRGYNHNLAVADGEMFHTENLTTEYFPLMAQRKKRGYGRRFTSAMGLAAKDRLYYVDDGKLYRDGVKTGLTGLSEGEKQLVGMGAYLLIFPDKVYYNTADGSDYGSMEAEYISVGNINYRMCRADGEEYGQAKSSDTQPSNAQNGELWIDTGSIPHVLKQYSAAADEWTAIPTVYTKLIFSTYGVLTKSFREKDGVSISGAKLGDVNGEKIIQKISGNSTHADSIVLIGLIEETGQQSSGSVRIRREVPEMDFVCEAQNRLWGCRHDEEYNELYCCALGDFRNWNRYEGISIDSWRASLGSDGDFTGAVNYMGYPTFFKRDRIYRITVASNGGHSVSETVCRGVQPGSSKSIAVVNETLIYKSDSDVCAYQGGFPASISSALGTGKFSGAIAGTVNNRYYISMLDEQNEAQLFVYDAKLGLWMREDDLRPVYFATFENELYCIADNRLIALTGSTGEKEPFVSWEAESGMLNYRNAEKKYVSRFNLRVQMEEGAELEIWLRYDEEKDWQLKGRLSSTRNRTVCVPVRPRRCDHLRIKLKGKGEFRLFSIGRNLSYGSDV